MIKIGVMHSGLFGQARLRTTAEWEEAMVQKKVVKKVVKKVAKKGVKKGDVYKCGGSVGLLCR